jgi:hypothetical protein
MQIDLNLENAGADTLAGGVTTFGQVFTQGEVGAKAGLVATVNGVDIPVQMDVKTTYADGSVKMAVLSMDRPDLAAGATAGVSLSTVASAAASTPIDLSTALNNHSFAVDLTNNGQSMSSPRCSRPWPTAPPASGSRATSRPRPGSRSRWTARSAWSSTSPPSRAAASRSRRSSTTTAPWRPPAAACPTTSGVHGRQGGADARRSTRASTRTGTRASPATPPMAARAPAAPPRLAQHPPGCRPPAGGRRRRRLRPRPDRSIRRDAGLRLRHAGRGLGRSARDQRRDPVHAWHRRARRYRHHDRGQHGLAHEPGSARRRLCVWARPRPPAPCPGTSGMRTITAPG